MHKRGAIAGIGSMVALLMLTCAAWWLPRHAAAQVAPGATVVEEQRVALVIGNAAYADAPLDNAVNDARLIARTLEQAGFKVTLAVDITRAAMLRAMQQFGDRLGAQSVAVLYYAGHAVQLRDRNFLIPVDGEIGNEDDVVLHGVDVNYMLERMGKARSRVNVVILDACRDNPAAKRAGQLARGLAPMDAPIGTFLAFATAPGKAAPDNAGGGSNSAYSASLARHMLERGVAIEILFKRVREDVLHQTRQLQVPWEHSSLTGEFSFVPGVAAVAATPAAGQRDAEFALWQRAEASSRADESRAYLRQYPEGRYADAARSRIEALAAPATSTPTTADLMPRTGDTWRYRITDQFRLGDLFVTARVDSASADGVAETWTSTSDARVRTTLVPLKAGFSALPGWDIAPPEFAPYLQAMAATVGGPLPLPAPQQRRVDKVTVPLRPQWLGEEEVVVGAGRFKTQKLRLRGEVASPKISAEYTVWYAQSVRRFVKYEVKSHAGATLLERTTFELTEYKLN